MEQTTVAHCQMLIFKERNVVKREFFTLLAGKKWRDSKYTNIFLGRQKK